MNKSKISEVFEKGNGILQLTPTWVPRGFNEPGKRLKLHPDDYFAFGMDRGGICERWLGSITKALNGPKTGETEGLSFVLADPKTEEKILFSDFLEVLGARLIGRKLQESYGTWPAFAKLYDYDKPLFHHLHLPEEKANKIGLHGKPEAYYFPHQYNSYLGKFPLLILALIRLPKRKMSANVLRITINTIPKLRNCPAHTGCSSEPAGILRQVSFTLPVL